MNTSSWHLGSNAGQHTWKFFRAGGLDQVAFESGADFADLSNLDPKLWVALSCPTRGLEFDSRTLDLIDSDQDGRIRVPEIRQAVQWAVEHLRDPAELVRGGMELPLNAINDRHESGRRLLASARQILANLGKPGAAAVTVEDTADTGRIFGLTRFNGDGIIPAKTAADDATNQVIAEIIATCGAKIDRAGVPGVDQATVDTFFKELQSYADWWNKAEAASAGGAGIIPLGDATPGAYEALKAVRGKIEDYFARCRVAAFDPRAAGPLNGAEAEFVALAANDLSTLGTAVAALPLAHIEAGRPLPLTKGLNPAWAKAVKRLHKEVLTPILGAERSTLSESEWTLILERFAPFEAWMASKSGLAVEKLGIARIKEILAGSSRDAINRLIAQDLVVAPEMAAVESVERLARYHRDLYTLLNNFVSFTDFYSPSRLAVFQAGTLYLDGRSCELCIKVNDIGKHAGLASLGRIYLAYCECTRKDSPAKLTIVAAFTAGDSDYLLPGRNGLFYDRQGRDWDATIVKVIENPMSIRQAVWAPYKRVARMIGEQIEKMAAARDKASQERAAAGIDTTARTVEQPKPGPAQPTAFDIGKMVGIFAAIGLALGALGTALAMLVKSFLGLVWWQMPLAILAVFVLISGPSVVLAWLKLRQRTLGPVLDASGWAINGRVKINIPLGHSLTAIARLPANSIRALEDPYAEERVNWRRVLLLLLLVLAIIALLFCGVRDHVLAFVFGE